MKKVLSIALSACLMILVVACNNTATENDSTNSDSANTENVEEQDVEEVAQDESFDDFYAKFISDNEFQLSRVQFPLKGGMNDFDGTEEWSIDQWYYIQDIATATDDDPYLETEITQTETSVKHVIFLPSSGFSVDYTYELIDGLWFLVERNSNNF